MITKIRSKTNISERHSPRLSRSIPGINRSDYIRLLPIEEIAAKVGLKPKDLEFYGPYKAKIKPVWQKNPQNKLILVTAMTPGKFGEGKTTTAIGLSQALWQLGEKNLVVLREPSMGPCFGLKGGATGGGQATVEPQEEINLHFTGDIHAVTYAHNLLASMIDNSLYFENPLKIETDSLFWPRVLDLNDRALRHLRIKMTKKNGETLERDTYFDISVASEVMTILCLAKNEEDLKNRLAKITIGFDQEGKPVTAKMLKAEGAMTALLKKAMKPNLVQTQEGTPALVHGGPFANIAHGSPSLLAIKTAQSLADYTIVESGFGADLGAEKFVNIVSRMGELEPKVAVLVVTTRALSESGFENLSRHVENLQNFGLKVILCLNRFVDDASSAILALHKFAEQNNLPLSESFVFQKGGEGGLDLGKKVMALCQAESKPSLKFSYDLKETLDNKILAIVRQIYKAKDVSYSEVAKAKLDKYRDLAKDFFVCLAKSQYSFSHDPNLSGAPKDYTFLVSDLRLATGAGFVIPIAGEIMTMPGLPRHPLAENF